VKDLDQLEQLKVVTKVEWVTLIVVVPRILSEYVVTIGLVLGSRPVPVTHTRKSCNSSRHLSIWATVSTLKGYIRNVPLVCE